MISEYDNYTDDELIDLLRNNDADAMEYLIKKYSPLVKKSTRTLFLIGADSQDLSQEGMIGLFKAIQKYDVMGDASFFTYAQLCINRQIASAIKASNRQKHIPLNSYISLYSTINESNEKLIEIIEAGKNSNPELMFVDKENTSSIHDFIKNELSKMEQQVLDLYLTGLSVNDIANKMGKTKKQIENAISRIREKLKKFRPD